MESSDVKNSKIQSYQKIAVGTATKPSPQKTETMADHPSIGRGKLTPFGCFSYRGAKCMAFVTSHHRLFYVGPYNALHARFIRSAMAFSLHTQSRASTAWRPQRYHFSIDSIHMNSIEISFSENVADAGIGHLEYLDTAGLATHPYEISLLIPRAGHTARI
jgi:hypothetical protein